MQSESSEILDARAHDTLLYACIFRLQLDKRLGRGAFGTVFKGMWKHIEEGCDLEEEVAVKTLKGKASEEERIKFLQEAAVMGQFVHPNIIRILGVCVDNLVCFFKTFSCTYCVMLLSLLAVLSHHI